MADEAAAPEKKARWSRDERVDRGHAPERSRPDRDERQVRHPRQRLVGQHVDHPGHADDRQPHPIGIAEGQHRLAEARHRAGRIADAAGQWLTVYFQFQSNTTEVDRLTVRVLHPQLQGKAHALIGVCGHQSSPDSFIGA